MRAWLAIALAGLAGTAAGAASLPEWTQPQEPFHVVGPIEYVGTAGIAVYLIRTRAGLILLDSGPEKAVPIVERNIAKLGLKLSDVRIILTTHAHWDHVAGLATLKRDTGARLLASAGDRPALESGVPPSDTDYGVMKFPAVKVDGQIVDGRAVRLGEVSMTPIITPGHTPGCTSWTMQVKEHGHPLRVIFLCSITVAGNRLVDNKGYPGIIADFRASFKRLRTVKADVVLPPHPEIADVIARGHRQAAGDDRAFIAPELLARIVETAETNFDKELRKQEQHR